MKKRRKIKFTQTGDIESMPDCCGLEVLGGFFDACDSEWGDEDRTIDKDVKSRNTALIATTIPEQRAAIKELKALGFTALRRFYGHHGNRITLWYIAPKRRRSH